MSYRSKHTMKAYMPFGLGEIEVSIRYTYLPGRPAVMYLRNGDPGYPAEDPEIEFVSATSTLHQLDDMMQKMLDEWAAEYLAEDEGFAAAMEHAESGIEAAREYAAELRAER